MQDEVNWIYLEVAKIATVKSPREIDLEARLILATRTLSEYSHIVADCAGSGADYETLLGKLTALMDRLNASTRELNKAVVEGV